MSNLIHYQQNRKQRQDFLAKLAALKHIYPAAGSIEELVEKRPRLAWQIKCRFRKACTASDRAGCDAAEVCEHLMGTRYLKLCLPLIDRLLTIDEIARPPRFVVIGIVVDTAVIVDRRAEITERPRTTAGPPRERQR